MLTETINPSDTTEHETTTLQQGQIGNEFPELSVLAADFASKISKYAKATTENIICMCESFFRAKGMLPTNDFAALCKAFNYQSDSPTIKKYILIGERAHEFRSYLDRLPNSWTTLYELTHLDNNLLHGLIEAGDITSSSTGKDVKAIVKTTKSNSNSGKPPRNGSDKPTQKPSKDASSDENLIEYRMAFDQTPEASKLLQFEESVVQLIGTLGIYCRPIRSKGIENLLNANERN